MDFAEAKSFTINATPKQKSRLTATAKESEKPITTINLPFPAQIKIYGGVKVSTGVMRYGKRVELSNSKTAQLKH